MKSILIVEQDTWLGDMYEKKLSREYNVYVVADAQGAIDVLDNHDISLIVTDLELGKHNGVEILHEVRSYDDWMSIPIILLSSLPKSEVPLNKEQMKRYNIVSYIYKHKITPDELQGKIDSIMTTAV